MTTDHLIAWLPHDQRKPLLKRLLIVWAVSLPIAVATWMGRKGDGLSPSFDVSLVYAYAISTFIWLFTDVSRFVFKKVWRAQAPFYWPPVLQASLMLLMGIPLGYVLGTLVGDAYAGWSTWDLWRLNTNRFVGMMVGAFFISAGFVTFFYQRGKTEALTSQVTQAQLMLLQSQLEPHMLFNTLAHLRALIGQDTARALAMLDHLDDYLRTTLQASRQALHSLSDEFSRLDDYLNLMAIRMGPRLVFDLNLPHTLAGMQVPSFILQPLVENAIRHGLEPMVAGGRIEVQARTDGAVLLLTVRDNGCGISDMALAESGVPMREPTASVTPSASWGLSHVRQRLHTLYGDRASMHITPMNSGGTCVVLNLPLTAAVGTPTF